MSEIEALLDAQIQAIDKIQKARFCTYYEILTDWNQRVNLTSVTQPLEVVQKHFLDSLLPLEWELIPSGARCIDVGSGAGFPGIPLMIMREDIHVVLLDSLNKRVDFLKEVCRCLKLNATTVHARAEDAARDTALREQHDIALTRAVAALPVLCELTVPFLKVGGSSIAYKSADIEDEIQAGSRAFELLKCQVKVYTAYKPWGGRSLVSMRKLERTAAAYPRKAGTPNKKPL